MIIVLVVMRDKNFSKRRDNYHHHKVTIVLSCLPYQLLLIVLSFPAILSLGQAKALNRIPSEQEHATVYTISLS